ncbi:MAG: hypothetical protein IPN20_08840 [Haliscomenobacter sp.]|nr:hypothetical protein [Haliscomenobacter sp.]
MDSRTFFSQLAWAMGLATAGILALYATPALHAGIPLAWIALCFFIGFSLVLYVAAKRTAKSPKKTHFINLVLGMTILKMLFSFVLIAAYSHWAHPASNLFALPFFGIYLIFTIFETAFMIRVGKS